MKDRSPGGLGPYRLETTGQGVTVRPDRENRRNHRGRTAMEIGLYIKFGKLVPGREEKAIDLFGEAIEYFGEKMAIGWLTFFEPFFFQTSDREEETGFFVLKGPV